MSTLSIYNNVVTKSELNNPNVSVGTGCENFEKKKNSISIGYNTGFSGQGTNSIAIGKNAGVTNQSENSIILNASGNVLNSITQNSFYVSPIREISISDYSLVYNTTTKEINYLDALNKNGLVVTSVNNKTMFSYPGYNYRGSNFIPSNNFDITTLSGLSSMTSKWSGGVLAPNGKIFFTPVDETRMLVLDTNSNTIEYIPGFSSQFAKYYGGVVAYNQKIYSFPFYGNDPSNPQIVIVDTNTYEISYISMPSSDTLLCSQCCLGADEKVYGTPTGITYVPIVDPVTNTLDITSIKNIDPTKQKFAGIILGSDGKMYTVPRNVNYCLIVDPNSPVTTITFTGTPTYNDSLKILTCSGTSFLSFIIVGDNILITTNTNNSYTGYVNRIISNTSLEFIYNLGTITGNIISLQKTRRADMTTLSNIDIISVDSGGDNYTSGILHTNNKIYMVPRSARNVLIIDPNSPITNLTFVTGSASYNNTNGFLTSNGSSFITELSIGENVIINVNNLNGITRYVGYVNRIINNQTITFFNNLGVNINTNEISSLQKTRKVDFTTFSGLSSDINKWAGGSLGMDNKIYLSPRSTSSVLIIDPNSPSTTITSNINLYSYSNTNRTLSSGVGGTFLSTFSVGDMLIINVLPPPISDIITQYVGYIQTISSNTSLTLFYPLGVEINAGSITSIVRSRQVNFTTIPINGVTQGWVGSVLGSNGIIYGVPHDATSIYRLKTGIPTLPPWILSSQFNKF